MKAISEHGELVSDQRTESDGEDPALNQWEARETTDDVERFVNR